MGSFLEMTCTFNLKSTLPLPPVQINVKQQNWTDSIPYSKVVVAGCPSALFKMLGWPGLAAGEAVKENQTHFKLICTTLLLLFISHHLYDCTYFHKELNEHSHLLQCKTWWKTHQSCLFLGQHTLVVVLENKNATEITILPRTIHDRFYCKYD